MTYDKRMNTRYEYFTTHYGALREMQGTGYHASTLRVTYSLICLDHYQ